jgi:hypothetical protein
MVESTRGISGTGLSDAERWEGIPTVIKQNLCALAKASNKGVEERREANRLIKNIADAISQTSNEALRNRLGIEYEGALTAYQMGDPERYGCSQ